MRDHKIRFKQAALLMTSALSMSAFHADGAEKNDHPNVLFIAVDDLKPNLGCYGNELIHTPNIDELADQGMTFMRNYCQQAVSAPSRASLLTGQYPDATEVWDLHTLIREKNPDIVTMPQYYKQQGYQTAATGKLFDPRSTLGKWGGAHDAPSWSIDYVGPSNLDTYNAAYGGPEFGLWPERDAKEKLQRLTKQAQEEGVDENLRSYVLERYKPSTGRDDLPYDAYTDGAIVKHGMELMEQMAASEKPFFLGVGFKKPHLPFCAPEKYWDLYERSDFSLAHFQKHAKNSPEMAYHNFGELRSYSDIPDEGPVPEQKQLELIHGYYAATSFIDHLVGMLTHKLNELGLKENTIVILWGDHGWHLGDHNLWCKHSNFEQATRTPMIIKFPGQKPAGARYYHPSEFVDIAPTLCQLSGLEIPGYFQGKSLVPALNDPEVKVREAAMSQYPRGPGKKYMGYSVRTERFRYTKWVDRETGEEYDTELYDYQLDPEETVSRVDDPDYQKVVKRLDQLVRDRYELPIK